MNHPSIPQTSSHVMSGTHEFLALCRTVVKKGSGGQDRPAEPRRGAVPDGADLAATLGVKGHRPTVGTRECKDLLYAFCAVNLISAAIHSNTMESPQRAKQKTGKSKTRRMQEAFADHLRHI